MITRYEVIGNDEAVNNRIYECAAGILQEGGLVAFPTETVYGLGGNGLNPLAAAKIYAAKGRPSDNPLIVHIADVDDLNNLCRDIPKKALVLAEAFWPGPLTMILNKKENIPHTTTGGLDTVAVRMPDNEIALKLIKKSGVYIAAPSANLSGRPSPTKGEHVLQDMDGRIDMIIDGGSVELGIESTIVDLTEDTPMILRPGIITRDMLESVVGKVELDKALAEGVDSLVAPKAPGMKYRHYAPAGEMIIVEGNNISEVSEYINSLIDAKKKEGLVTGVLATDETAKCYAADYVISVGKRKDEISISSHLFDVLRQFDDLKVDFIVSEGFSRDNVGYAIMNRLLKAAGGRIINIQGE